MSVSLQGNLEDFGIADVFQLIGQQRKTGVLELQGEGERVQFLFDRGAVVSAAPVGLWSHAALGEMLLRCGLLSRERVDELRRTCESSAQTLPNVAVERGWLEPADVHQIEVLLTSETIFGVLRWQSGSFDFKAQEVEHDRPFDKLLGAEQILMDGLRMVDEWQSFAELVPSEATVFHRTGSFPQYVQRSTGETDRQRKMVERVYSLVDGRLSVRRVIDLSLLGTFDAVRAMASLHRVGVIEPLDPAGVEALEKNEQEAAPRAPRIGRFGSIAIPFALLVVVAVLAQVRVDSTEVAFRVDRPAQLERVRRSFETRRVRHALETYYFVEGRWPERLDALESSGQLAATMGGPYYYANHEGRPWLLGSHR